LKVAESEYYDARESRSDWLTVRAFMLLLSVDLKLKTMGFRQLHSSVKNCPVSARTPHTESVARMREAVDKACVWYPKQALCLQRSAVLTLLLRRAGIDARMVLAARRMPLKMHAWVEVNDVVVNDDDHVQDYYSVMEKI
jgi:Transglutaminase-like superfamily.